MSTFGLDIPFAGYNFSVFPLTNWPEKIAICHSLNTFNIPHAMWLFTISPFVVGGKWMDQFVHTQKFAKQACLFRVIYPVDPWLVDYR
jgi:hypothetical protein